MNKPMIRLRYLFVVVAVTTLFASCFKDDTTLGTGAISEIVIDNMKEVYNINQNDTLIITPTLTQTHQPKEVSYTWEMDMEHYSDSCCFVFVGKQFGSYNCRLIVENSDGKSFFPFVIHVNTIYEEGLTIISKDANGKAMLSFMLTPPDGGEPVGFMQGDQFTKNNEEPFADNPVDIIQSGGSLIIACQGSVDGTVPPTIYSLNEKTFFLENMTDESTFSDFKPTLLGIPSETYPGRSYPILCEGGNTYEYSTNEAVISKPIKLPYSYSQRAFINSKGSGRYNFLCWDKEINALCQIYDGYAPAYYYGTAYHMSRETIEEDSRNNPLDGHEFLTMVPVEQHDTIKSTPEALVVTRDAKGIYCKTLLSVEFWEERNGKVELVGETKKHRGQLTLTEETPCVANKTYSSMLFADGNRVYRWYYDSSVITTNVLQSVGTESAIITAMSLSPDLTKTYVAFYDPEQTGLNGSVWIIDTDKGTILNKYDNVCYQPVKIIYKKK